MTSERNNHADNIELAVRRAEQSYVPMIEIGEVELIVGRVACYG
jgi:hypothetical protein